MTPKTRKRPELRVRGVSYVLGDDKRGEGGVRFHDLVDTMSQDIVDTC